MGQFKPMVKMMTTEPTVELKLKKGGHVAKKAFGGMTPAPISVAGKLSARGGATAGAAPKKPSLMERRKAMSGALLMSKKGGTAKHEDAAQDRAMIKKALAGKKFASGGEIDKFETKTTIEGNAGKFAKTKMNTSKKDKAHGTGEVKEGKPAGYATGGSIPSETSSGSPKTTRVYQAKKDTAHGTGGVRMANAGGFKSGGNVDWENLPARGTPPGKTNTKTGEVKESNAGGYKKGGAAKKAYATGGEVDMGQADRTLRQTSRGDTSRGYVVVDKSGKTMSSHKSQSDAIREALKSDDYKVKRQYASGGNVVDDGKAVKMPRHFISRPVANTMQSGTFKKGGNVKMAKGGEPESQMEKAMRIQDALPRSSTYDPVGELESRRREAEQETIRRENEATPVMDSVKRMLGIRPNAGAGRGFVNPVMPRKAGGRAKR